MKITLQISDNMGDNNLLFKIEYNNQQNNIIIIDSGICMLDKQNEQLENILNKSVNPIEALKEQHMPYILAQNTQQGCEIYSSNNTTIYGHNQDGLLTITNNRIKYRDLLDKRIMDFMLISNKYIESTFKYLNNNDFTRSGFIKFSNEKNIPFVLYYSSELIAKEMRKPLKELIDIKTEIISKL